MTGVDLGAFVFGWLFLGILGALWVFLELSDDRGWEERPAFAVAFLVALTGPLALAGVTLRGLWRMSRTIAAGFGDLGEMRRERRLALSRATREQAVELTKAEIEVFKANKEAKRRADEFTRAARAARRKQ